VTAQDFSFVLYLGATK